MALTLLTGISAFAEKESLLNDGYVPIFSDDFEGYEAKTYTQKELTKWKGTSASETFEIVNLGGEHGKVVSALGALNTEGTTYTGGNNLETQNSATSEKNVKLSIDFYAQSYRYIQMRLYSSAASSNTWNLWTIKNSTTFCCNGEKVSKTIGNDFFGKWHTATAYLDFTNMKYMFYLDGELLATDAIPTTFTDFSKVRMTFGANKVSKAELVTAYIDNFSVETLNETKAANEISQFDYVIYSDDFENGTINDDVTARANMWNASGRATIAASPDSTDGHGNVAYLVKSKNMETKNWVMAGNTYTAANLKTVNASLDMRLDNTSTAQDVKVSIYKGKTKDNTNKKYDNADILSFENGVLKYFKTNKTTLTGSSYSKDTWYHVDVNFTFDTANNTGTYSMTVTDGTNTYSTDAGVIAAPLGDDTIGLYSIGITAGAKANVYVDNVKVTKSVPVSIVRKGNGEVSMKYTGNKAFDKLDSYELILAKYSSDGKLMGADISSCTTAEAETTASVTLDGAGQYVKGYLWTGADSGMMISKFAPVN